MSIRDEELKRIDQYSKSLGIVVVKKQHKRGDPGATWHLDNGQPVLTLYYWPGQSKIQIILNYIHELAHHMSWIYNNQKIDEAVDKALDDSEHRDLPKKERKIIYDMEVDDAKYRLSIYKELNLKFPEYKLMIDIALDDFIYKTYYLTGSTPSTREITRVKKELALIYKNS